MPARTIKRTNAQQRNALDRSVPKKTAPAIISSIANTGANTIEITFDTRVFRNQTPGYTAGAGGAETVVSATEVSATVIEVEFTGAVAGTNLIVPEADQGVRTPSGGFVPAGVYAIPATP